MALKNNNLGTKLRPVTKKEGVRELPRITLCFSDCNLKDLPTKERQTKQLFETLKAIQNHHNDETRKTKNIHKLKGEYHDTYSIDVCHRNAQECGDRRTLYKLDGSVAKITELFTNETH